MDLASKVCVVTGASSGIGRRTALEMARRGARVCLAARRGDLLRQLAEQMGGESRGHSYLEVDVTERDRVRALAEHVQDTYSRCDVLVNSAGIPGRGSFEGVGSFQTLDAVMATNFFGAVNCTALFLPLLERAAPSHVVNIASVAGRVALGRSSAYCASKFALVGWSEAIRFDLEPRGVFVSLIEPGPLPTEAFPQSRLVGHSVLRRGLTSDAEVARAVCRVIGTKRRRRVIPRGYHAAVMARLLMPPVYRAAVRRIIGSKEERGE